MTNPTDPRSITKLAEHPHSQIRATIALLALVQEDAPAAQWLMSDRGTRLDGQLMMHDRTDTDRRRALAAWQRIIGAGPVQVNTMTGGGEHLSISGSYEGVPVLVGTIVSSAPVCCDQCQGHGDAA